MKLAIRFMFVFGLTLLLLPVETCATPTLYTLEEVDGVIWAGPAWRQEMEDLRVFYFTGTPTEIGIQYGLLSSDEAEEMRQQWRQLDPAYSAKGFEKLWWGFRNLYARFQFVPKFKRYIPAEYLAEMQGFLLGASGGQERDYYEVLMANVSQDLMLAAPACSAVAAWGEATLDGELYIGRNLDHPTLMVMADMQSVAVYEPSDGYRFAVHGYPAHVGTMSGMNEHGLVISSNYSIATANECNIDGMPYMIMMRQVLQYAATLDEALAIIRTTPRTIGLNIMLADSKAGKAVVVEVSANRMAVREGDNYIFSSNMYQDPTMKQYQGPGWMASSLRDQRFAQLRDIHWGTIDVPVIRDILRDKLPAPDSDRQWFNSSINSEVNMASMVFVPERGEIWAGVVSGNETPFAADSVFVGVDVRAMWDTGQPQEPLGILPATERVGYDKHWLMAREAYRMFNQFRLEEAMESVEQVLAEYPNAGIPTFLKGRIYGRGREFAQALSYLEGFLAFDDHQEPYYWMIGAFWAGVYADHLGEREKARSYYKQVLQIEVEDLSQETDFFSEWATLGLIHPLMIHSDGRVIKR